MQPPAPAAAPTAALYERLLQECESCLELARCGEPFSVSGLGELTVELVQAASNNADFALQRSLQNTHPFSIALHGTNVAVLTVRVGQELGLKAERLSDMALAGLLNDIGMVAFSDLAQSPSVLDEGQMIRLREHPWVGQRLLQRCSGLPQTVRQSVLQEHERVDGSGYPQKLSGNRVHEDAQLIGLLDVYEALTHERPHRRALLPAEAMRAVICDHRAAFRDELLSALLHAIPIYPRESWVELSSGHLAVVVEESNRNPLSPVVRVWPGPGGPSVAPSGLVDLSRDATYSIVRAVREPLRG
jgi:HD-GYP domain-containing protein (c-di-GMP phosphodiesterase class II)